MEFSWFNLAVLIALLLAGLTVLWAHRRERQAAQRAADMEARAEAAEYAAHVAETEATISYGKGLREATDEINRKRERDEKASYDRGFESGWNTCYQQFEQSATIINGGGSEAKRAAAA